MDANRRQFLASVAAASVVSAGYTRTGDATQSALWHEDIAQHAATIAIGKPLRVLVPSGSEANVRAASAEFSRLTGLRCIIEVIDEDDINMELILRRNAGDKTVDVALPATFALIDLVQSKAIAPLDDYAQRYEPVNFSQGRLYQKGDRYRGKLYGYQTDGDAYLMFYNKRMLEDPEQIKAYRALTGRTLQPATSWEELDNMMAFFHRPDQGQYGGSLFRNASYLVWEWWARFHAKGCLPFHDDMQPNINNTKGIAALEELVAATDSLTPNAKVNGLTDNWHEFSRGNVFCNIGWGGTQKYLMSHAVMRDNLIHSALPGPVHNGQPSFMGYFNWGWNYAVGAHSLQPELSYLLCLFCASEYVSTLSIRESDGFFDPFHVDHYIDPQIEQVYGGSFLKVHKENMRKAIPDLYMSGQSNYMDALRQQILATLNGELTASEALDICSRRWSHITRRFGKQSQLQQWRELLATYPEHMRQSHSGG